MDNTGFIVKILFWGAVLVAALLRVWGLDSGLPYVKIHVDENTMVNVALAIPQLQGALWTSGNGFLMPYLLFVIYGAYYVVGSILGVFTSLQSFLISYLSDTGTFILIGRVFNVIIALLSVWFVYKSGKEWFGDRVGLLAAWFLAVAFIHVKESHYVKNDVLVGLLVLLLFHISCLVAKEGKRMHYIFGGLVSGLAFGVKIYPILAGIMVLVAHWIYTSKHSLRFVNLNSVLLAGVLLIIILLQVVPTMLHPGGVGEFLRIGGIIRDLGTKATGLVFISYLGHLKEGSGTLIMVAALVGGVVATRNVRKPHFLLLIMFPLFYLATVEWWGGYNVARHAIILLPSLVLLAGVGVDSIAKRVPRKSQAILLLGMSMVVIIPTLDRSIKMDTYFSGIDTREQAKEWIEKNIPARSKIVIEGTLKPYIPAGAASLFLDQVALEREIERARRIGSSRTTLEALREANSGKVSYDILATPKIDKAYNIELGEETQMVDVSFYEREGYKIIATMNWAHFRPLNPDFERDFNRHFEKIAHFSPTINFTASPHDTFIQYDKLDSINLFQEELIVGPTVEIYKEKEK